MALTPLQPGANPILRTSPEDERRVVEAENMRQFQAEAKRRHHLESVGVPVGEGKRLGLDVREDRVGVFGNQRLSQPPTVERLPPGRV